MATTLPILLVLGACAATPADPAPAEPETTLGNFSGVRLGTTLDGVVLEVGEGRLEGSPMILNYWMSS
jgi:hypothetical protein